MHSNPDKIFIEVKNVTKTFPGVRALDGVCFELACGEVHALVGENGAGKSTLMHVLGGVYQPDLGQVLMDGEQVTFNNLHSALQHGISVVFQELSLSENLSIAENIFAHRQPVGKLGMIDWNALYSMTSEMLDLFDWEINPRTPVKELSAAKQQVVEILKAVSMNPKVLILDEPTSSLTAAETDMLFSIIRRLKTEGMSFIYISHHLSEIFDIADRVTVMRDGKHVHTCRVSEVTEQDLIKKMVGRELVDMYGSRDSEIGGECFRVANATSPDAFYNVSLSVRQGEILGVYGLAGSGRTELARAVFGLESMDTGTMMLHGQTITVTNPHEAITEGIAYLSEDRKDDGLFLDMSVRENIAAPCLSRFTSKTGLVDEKAVTAFAENYRSLFGIASPSVDQPVGLLSGGNQQKVLLAMWVGTHPRLLIADEPTRGVDVGAKSEIFRLLRSLAADGVGIILISSDMPEILGLSDRILVMRSGRIAGEFTREQATEQTIVACATGVVEETE